MTLARLKNLKNLLAEDKLDALLLTRLENVEYVSGYTGSYASALISPGKPILFTDSRYQVQSKAECPGFSIKMIKDAITDDAVAEAGRRKIGRLGFESDGLLYSDYQRLLKKAKEYQLKFVPTKGLVQKLRNTKDFEEITRMRAAAQLTDRAWQHILGYVKAGVRELDLALELESFIRTNGGLLSFDCIVVSGDRSALPHGKPSEKKLAGGDFVTFDFGARVGRYCADLTRTVVIGKPSGKHREIYKTVLSAQLAGINAIKPGMKCREVDRIARDVIRKAGYGKHFGHGLGHSLGLLTHDGQRMSPKSAETEILAPNMILTVEPGIYLEGWGGCRIEDDVLVTPKGCEVLTQSAKEFLVI